MQFDTLGGEMVSNAAQNGFGAANKLNNLLMTPLNGLGAAMTSFTAQNLGAGDHAIGKFHAGQDVHERAVEGHDAPGRGGQARDSMQGVRVFRAGQVSEVAKP